MQVLNFAVVLTDDPLIRVYYEFELVVTEGKIILVLPPLFTPLHRKSGLPLAERTSQFHLLSTLVIL